MTTSSLPLGAEAPDDLLVPYVNGSLTAQERAEVERWLAANPEWNARLDVLHRIRAAVRQAPPAAAAGPPELATLAGPWAAIHLDRRRRRRWLPAAAAALVVVAGAALLGTRGDGEDSATDAPAGVGSTDPAAGADEPAGAATVAADPIAALRASADVTAEARTANVSFRASATVDLGPAAAGAPEHMVVEMAGTGQVELPGRSIIDTRTTTRVPGGTDLLPASTASVVVEADGRTFVRCGGETGYTERDPGAASCLTLALGPGVFGPDATIDMIEQSSSVAVAELGGETIGGVETTGYQMVDTVELEGEAVPLAIQIWVDADSYIRRIVGATEYGSEDGGRTSLVIIYELTDFGVVVDIPDLD